MPLSASDWDGSDWDGSDGWPMKQLADTHTRRVRLEDSVSDVLYLTPNDCVTPVAFVIEGNI